MKLDWTKFTHMFHSSWHVHMQEVIESPQMWDIFQSLKNSTAKITPKSSDLFKSFQIDLNSLAVVIVGQDPYPKISFTGYQANGLAFDCRNYGKVSPSLTKLYEAWENDCYNSMSLLYDKADVSLEYLINQGVMLTNASLSCEQDNPGSHYELWKPFWKLVYQKVFCYNSGLVFILMGKSAHQHEEYADKKAHNVFKCEHPVAASYAKRAMKHNNVFSEANKVLKGTDNRFIHWLAEKPPF